jgi:hypothetical protein
MDVRPFLTIVITAFFIAGCGNTSTNPGIDEGADDSTSNVAKQQSNAQQILTACYSDISPKDSVILRIIQKGDSVSGTLFIQIEGKDRNTGTIQGIIKGDTLTADYSFMSEGMQSVREEVFLKRGNALVPGYGPIKEKDGKMIFVNMGSLTFDDNMRLEETTCPQ